MNKFMKSLVLPSVAVKYGKPTELPIDTSNVQYAFWKNGVLVTFENITKHTMAL